MKAHVMEGTTALIVTKNDLAEIISAAGTMAAIKAVEALRADLNQDPAEKQLQLLRNYIADRTTINNPRDHWASGRLIRMIAPNQNGKPKSVSWFQKFKQTSGLNTCPHRTSHEHGRLQEWCFEDIANVWRRNIYR